MKTFIYIFLMLLIVSCKNETSEKITNPADYNSYLNTSNNESYNLAVSQQEFWNQRLASDSSGVGDLGPLAGSYSMLFDATGNVDYLKDSEIVRLKAIDIAESSSKDTYKRGLATNYISQHRFKEAKQLMEESYAGPVNKNATEFILFDIYMELGEYDKADEVLGKIKNNSDINYLIRLSKWSDHKGDLDSAIKYMEQAKAKAETSNNKELKIWTYSNIADYYGHDGRIKDSYEHYLKTLELQPDNAYAKKGIAWIVYSYEKNSKEANRILDSIMVNRNVPDYHLLRAELAEFEGNNALRDTEWKAFDEMVQANPNYGGMYNTYLINVYTETNPQKALMLAQKEITNRATPETYQLLAYAQLVNGQKEAALQTIEQHVLGKTTEPKALFHAALIYKANGMEEKVKELKEELMGAKYELGPVRAKKIDKL